MGVKIFDLVPRKEVSFSDLAGKRLAIDASLFLYQFLTSVRQPDGRPFTDSKGRVTSHLIGLWNRTTSLMAQGLKLVFVFDGKAPDLKFAEIERRTALKVEAEAKYHIAVEKGDVEGMQKYASRAVRLTREMKDDARKVLDALGVPCVQAPAEGECQAAYMASKGDVWAVASQDADCLVFGAPRLVRNLAMTGKRKRPGTLGFVEIKPEIISLDDFLASTGLDRDQLIALAMLIGTDYNVGGIKGIGPQKGLKLVKQYGHDFESLFSAVNWSGSFEVSWKVVFDLFKCPQVSDVYDISWKPPDSKKLKSLLVDGFEFSEPRVNGALDRIAVQREAKAQKGLGSFI